MPTSLSNQPASGGPQVFGAAPGTKFPSQYPFSHIWHGACLIAKRVATGCTLEVAFKETFPDAGYGESTWRGVKATLRHGTLSECEQWANRNDSPAACFANFRALVKGRQADSQAALPWEQVAQRPGPCTRQAQSRELSQAPRGLLEAISEQVVHLASPTTEQVAGPTLPQPIDEQIVHHALPITEQVASPTSPITEQVAPTSPIAEQVAGPTLPEQFASCTSLQPINEQVVPCTSLIAEQVADCNTVNNPTDSGHRAPQNLDKETTDCTLP